jgi:hypothetical protein
VVKVKLQVWPVASIGDRNCAGPAVVTASCGAWSWLVQVTVSPTLIVNVAGP